MSYERFVSRFDTETDPGYYPEYSPEDEVNYELPFRVLLDNSALRVINQAVNRIDPSLRVEDGISKGISSLEWATDCMENGLDELLIVIPGNPVAAKVGSRIIDAPVYGKVSKRWVQKYQQARYKRLNTPEYTAFPFDIDVADALLKIEDRTGVCSFEVISIHGGSLLNLVSRSHSEGALVLARNAKENEVSFFPEELCPSFFSDVDKVKAFVKINNVIQSLKLVDPLYP